MSHVKACKHSQNVANGARLGAGGGKTSTWVRSCANKLKEKERIKRRVGQARGGEAGKRGDNSFDKEIQKIETTRTT